MFSSFQVLVLHCAQTNEKWRELEQNQILEVIDASTTFGRCVHEEQHQLKFLMAIDASPKSHGRVYLPAFVLESLKKIDASTTLGRHVHEPAYAQRTFCQG